MGENEEALYAAAEAGDLEEVKRLVAEGANINWKNCDASNCTAMSNAAYCGHTEVVEFLVSAGAQVSTISDRGYTPLHYACGNNFPEIGRILVQNGATNEGKDGEDRTPLENATSNDNQCCAELFDCPDECLYAAASAGHLNEVKRLVNAGSNMNWRNPDDSNCTALSIAAYNNKIAVVQYLVSRGADMNTVSGRGYLPLHYACSYGYPEIARILVSNGASTDGMNENERTPLDEAVLNEKPDIADLITGSEALYGAAQAGDLDEVKRLVFQGVNINWKNAEDSHCTPVSIAAYSGHTEVVQYLVAAGADMNALSDRGYLPLHYACSHNFPEIAQCLLTHGAKREHKNNNDRSPLEEALENGNEDIAAMF